MRKRILVTGMSGTGKSTALAELERRGFPHEIDATQSVDRVVRELIEIGEAVVDQG
jgi:dephospho-CoA kinase